MGAVLAFIAQYWWLWFIFGGSIAGGVKAVAAANERRADRRLERFRIKEQAKAAALQHTAALQLDEDSQRRAADKALAEHTATDARWFTYETDVIDLLEYPMMTNMRDPLTVAFHRAKLEADARKPADADELVGKPEALADYRSAVHDYVVAFSAAESEAKRRRRGDFGDAEQTRLVRAQQLLRLAMDDASTPAERQAAYRRARSELDGLVALPAVAYAQIEHRIAGALEA